MIRRSLATLFLIASLAGPAVAQERVTLGTMRHISNAVLFLAAAKDYFKAEGLNLEMTAYPSDEDVVTALAANATDFGLAGFSATAFNFAGKGAIKAIAAQVREKNGYEGNEIVASNAAYSRGLRKPENLGSASAAISQLGTTLHYQLGQIARVKGFNFAGLALKPEGSLDAIVRTISRGTADIAILPGSYARDMLTANQAKLVAWYSDVDEQQLGALFVSAKMLAAKRATIEKFLRAYRRAAAEYFEAFLRHDRYGKRISNAKSREAAAAIARYIYPGRPLTASAAKVEAAIYFMEAHARLDVADVVRQVTWYQSQGLVDKSIDARNVMDLSFK